MLAQLFLALLLALSLQASVARSSIASLAASAIDAPSKSSERSGASAPSATIATLRWTIPLPELVRRIGRTVQAFRFRRVELGSIDPPAPPKLFQDGIVCLHGDPGAVIVEETALARDKESIDLFPRRKVELFDLLRGETCSSFTEMGWVRPSILLYCPSPVPMWIYLLEGLVEPQRSAAVLLSDVESGTNPGCREATFRALDGESMRMTYALDESAHLLRLEIDRRGGDVETITWLGTLRDTISGGDVPLAVLRTIRRGGAPLFVELWNRIEVDRSCADICAVGPYAELIDLRVPGESGSSEFTDRELTLRDLLEYDTRPVARDARRQVKQTILCASESLSERPARTRVEEAARSRADAPRSKPTIAEPASRFAAVPGAPPIALTEFERRCLALIGVRAIELASATTALREETLRFAGRFEIPGFCEATIRRACPAGQPLFSFEPIGGASETLYTTSPCSPDESTSAVRAASVDPFFAWLAAHLPARLDPIEPVLRFHQVVASDVAEATLHVSPRFDSTGEIVIDGFRAGCGVELVEQLPIHVDRQPVELHFQCSISRPRPSFGNTVVRFELRGEPSLVMPMTIDAPSPRVVVSPTELAFAADEAPESDVEIATTSLRMQSIEIVRSPECIDIATTTARSQHVVIHVRETPVATQHHVCGTILALVKLASGEPPETIRISIRHERPERDATGARVLHGDFMPGEEIALYRRASGEITFACPDRIPCGEEMLSGQGFTPIAATKVPSAEEPFEWRVPSSDASPEPIRILGRANGRLGTCVPSWIRICN
jgi:hypothetical protein